MDRIKTGGQSKGDRMAAVTRDGFRPVLTKRSKKKQCHIVCKGNKGKTRYQPFQEADFLPPSLCSFCSLVSSPPSVSLQYHIYFFSQWWSLKHPRPQVTASISRIYRCRGQSNQGPLQLTRVMVHMLLFITESMSADSPHYSYIYVLDCITHSHENVLPKEN